MSHRKIIRVRSDARRRDCYLAGNPLWPLEELYDLRNPPFIGDPEFTPFDIHVLGCGPKSAPASPSDPTQVRPSKHRNLYGNKAFVGGRYQAAGIAIGPQSYVRLNVQGIALKRISAPSKNQ
jgi:hypothetical protein